MATLPQDIYDPILEHLLNDIAALKACSTVSKSFSLKSRKLLLRTLHLTGVNINRFISYAQRSPEILVWVHELYLHTTVELCDNSHLPALLRQFSQLRRFHWEGFRFQLYTVWRWLAPELQDSIRALLAQPTLTLVQISGVGLLPVNLFYQMNTGITCLRLSSLTLDGYPSSSGSNLQQICLKDVGFAALPSEFYRFMLSDISPFDFSNLQAFSTSDLNALPFLDLRSVQEHLQHLACVLPSTPAQEAALRLDSKFEFSLKHLRSLMLFPAYSIRDHSDISLSITSRMLQGILSSPHCELQEISLVLQEGFLHRTSSDEPGIDTWNAIDLVLCNWVDQSRGIIKVSALLYPTVDRTTALEELGVLLKNCCERGHITFDIIHSNRSYDQPQLSGLDRARGALNV